MSETIAAVVVTHNRLKLLQECIGAIRNQTRKLDEIIVVNNDSQDGTKEWLDEQSDLTKIHQENLGGAGGFHNGMKAAYEKGYDWIWLMDDDCYPKFNSLQKLIENNDKAEVLNSIVISKSNNNNLCFGLIDYKENKFYDSYSTVSKKDFIFGANFFNGTLLKREVIDIVGLPNSLFFIYGDEYEYFLRIKLRKLSIISVPKSIVLHPAQKYRNVTISNLNFRFNYCTKLRALYFPRNFILIYIIYKEFKFIRLLLTLIADICFIILFQRRIDLVLIYLKSITFGVYNTIYKKENYDQRFIAGL
ncbi:MAG: glycosyltransferase family 2 protein [Melioribacteraceae bacterium]